MMACELGITLSEFHRDVFNRNRPSDLHTSGEIWNKGVIISVNTNTPTDSGGITRSSSQNVN